MPRGPKPKNPVPEWARVLKARRALKGLRQEDVSERTEDRISPSTVSDLERGKVALHKLTHARLVDLATALEWTIAEMQTQTGVFLAAQDVANEQNLSLSDIERSKTLEFPAQTTMPIYDLVQASRPVEEMEPIPDLSPVIVWTSDVKPGMLVFRVRGDSMTTSLERSINEGDTIYVDTHDLTPQPEKVYVIHIPGDGVTLKRVRELGRDLWLFSDNPDQRSYPPFRVDEARVVGRVYRVIPEGYAV